MKNQNPPKKLTLIKKTIAHLDVEQLKVAKGGDLNTLKLCNPTVTNLVVSADCDTLPY